MQARIIRQLLYESGSVSEKFIPLRFSDGSADHVPRPVKGATRYVVDTEPDYERLCRQLTKQPRVAKPPLGKRKVLPPRQPKPQAAAAARSEEQASFSAPHPLVENGGEHQECRALMPRGLPTVTRLPGDVMAPKTIRWLHLSDLHMGCRGMEIWWQARSEFRESIRERFQPIDMILVMGDLTFAAEPEQFDLFDKFLDELLGWLRQAGKEVDPVVIPGARES